ncbi:hypothetical protein ACB092_08G051800 [Castanea dentata]
MTQFSCFVSLLSFAQRYQPERQCSQGLGPPCRWARRSSSCPALSALLLCLPITHSHHQPIPTAIGDISDLGFFFFHATNMDDVTYYDSRHYMGDMSTPI